MSYITLQADKRYSDVMECISVRKISDLDIHALTALFYHLSNLFGSSGIVDSLRRGRRKGLP